MGSVQKLAKDLRQAFASASGSRRPTPELRFHKEDSYLSLGLSASEFRKIVKGFRTRLLGLPLPERLNLASRLLGEHICELGHSGIEVLALSLMELTPRNYGFIDRCAGDFRDWSEVDHFCGDVLQPLLLKYRKETLDLIEKWNRSPCQWKRRASVVAFTRKIGESGQFTNDALRLCKNLCRDPEDLVRKGVGWALKDNLRSAPERVLNFVREARRSGVSSTITLYAIRDLRGQAREPILAERTLAPNRR